MADFLLDTTRTAISLVLSRAMKKYSGIKFILAHNPVCSTAHGCSGWALIRSTPTRSQEAATIVFAIGQ